MKLAIITAIESYKEPIFDILKKNKIFAFSFHEASGFKDLTDINIQDNWFGSDHFLSPSIVFNIFTDDHKINNLFLSLEEFNASREAESKIHISILNIEKSNAYDK
jgi:hypothetical protein